MHQHITSHHNPKIKSLIALAKPRERRKQCMFTIEGTKEIRMAKEAGYSIKNLFYCPAIIDIKELEFLHDSNPFIASVSNDVFEKIAVRENSGGVIAVASHKTHELRDLKISDNPLILVLESVEKPGNLGAILRIADAAALDAVIVCDPLTDFYNPNVIRSSVGCVFTTQVATATSHDAILWLQDRKINIICTYLKAAKPYHTIDYKTPTAIVMGTEATGLSDSWITHSQTNVIIPMSGRIDSMNVSTATAVVVFEAKRQRGF